jgi:23S rRNA (uridine2552-2'-O)-methyltransferase
MNNFNPRDFYFEKAKSQGYKARSVFKLEEMDQNFRLIKNDAIILDLGCAPGSWLQYVAKKINNKAVVLGVDITPVNEKFHPKIKTVVDDCFKLTEEKILLYMKDLIKKFSGFDVILSDMAPKTSGIKHVDQIKSFALAEKALNLADQFLKIGGHVVIKIFSGIEAQNLADRMKETFKTLKQVRPKSVRTVSKEFYLIGLHKMPKDSD